MTLRTLSMASLGVTTGAIQAIGLWRAAHRWQRSAWSLAWRLPLVGGLLVLAALGGGLLPATAGWAAGLAATSVLLLVRSTR